MSAFLEVNVAEMRFPTKDKPVINNVAFTATEGEVLSLVGPTGAGKTTLLRIIAGLERHFEGHVRIDGQEITRPSPQVQIIFQDNRLLPWKTVAGNLRFALPKAQRGTRREAVLEALRQVSLEDKQGEWPKTLSGGEESSLALARAFLNSPRVLLLDEPFRGLDLVTKYLLRTRLRDFISERRTTTIIVSHDIDDAVFLSDIIYVVSKEPLKLVATQKISIGQPRRRDDPELLEIHASVTNALFDSTRSSLIGFPATA